MDRVESARIYVNRENISVHFIPYGPSHQFWRKMWFREYKVWCVSVRKRTHIHCIFTVSFPRKWWKYKKIVILSKIFQLNNLSRRMIMKITIWSTYNNFFVFSSLAGNIQWICVRFRTETHQTLYSLNHIFLMTVFWSGVLSIYVNSRWSFFIRIYFQNIQTSAYIKKIKDFFVWLGE